MKKSGIIIDVIIAAIGICVVVDKCSENRALREENTRLQRDLGKANYHLGRLMGQKIYRC